MADGKKYVSDPYTVPEQTVAPKCFTKRFGSLFRKCQLLYSVMHTRAHACTHAHTHAQHAHTHILATADTAAD